LYILNSLCENQRILQVMKKEIEQVKIKLKAEDRKILQSYLTVVEGITAFFGKQCETVLYSLETPKKAILAITNGFHTGRKTGDPLSEHSLQAFLDFQKTGSQDFSAYTTSTVSGEPMRTVQMVLTNEDRPIGILGISFNMNIPLAEFISTFSLFTQPSVKSQDSRETLAADSVEDLIHNAVSEMVTSISSNITIPNHEKNKHIVYGLYDQGIFEIKGAVVLVAKELHLSKYTIYSYIRELKDKTKK
jgi:predicted transcriptional regulator YheO